MDMRSSQFYPTEAAATAAGVPAESRAALERVDGNHYVVKNGPFKGRMYRLNDLNQLVRDREAERARKRGR